LVARGVALPAFVKAAERATMAGKALLACLAGTPANVREAASAFDLSKWKGAPDSVVLDDFFYAAYAKLMASKRASVAAEDKVEAPLLLARPAVAVAANDNPATLDWRDADWDDDADISVAPASHDDEDDEMAANPALGAGWLAPLPDKPLPTYTAKRYPPPAKPQRGIFRSVLRTLVVFALISAGGFAGSLARAPQQQSANTGSVAALVTQADAESDDGAIEGIADVAPPVWLREPASAPEMREQG
jgi:hypothetical protein